MRIRLPHECQISFTDRDLGKQTQDLNTQVGDFVIRRADGLFTYQLAVVVDDHLQGITHIIRGEDLLSNTSRQIHLQQCLGYQTPSYLHLPLVTNDAGEKLNKQTKATAVDITRSESIRESLCHAANHLGLQNDPIRGSISQWLNRKVQEWRERHFI